MDFVSLGCPHLTIWRDCPDGGTAEGQAGAARVLDHHRPPDQAAWLTGWVYSQIIEASGAKFATDTCCVVAPIRGRFTALATDSAKACYYAASKNRFKTAFLPFDAVVELAVTPLREDYEAAGA